MSSPSTRIEYYAGKVEADILSFLSDDDHVSASKIAGVLGVANMLSYAVKRRVEYDAERMKKDFMIEDRLTEPPTLRQMGEWFRDQMAKQDVKVEAQAQGP